MLENKKHYWKAFIADKKDIFFDVLSANHLKINPKKNYYITTNLNYRFRKHKNLMSPLRLQQNTIPGLNDRNNLFMQQKNPSYLSLITDAYSKKIVEHFEYPNSFNSSKVKI